MSFIYSQANLSPMPGPIPMLTEMDSRLGQKLLRWKREIPAQPQPPKTTEGIWEAGKVAVTGTNTVPSI